MSERRKMTDMKIGSDPLTTHLHEVVNKSWNFAGRIHDWDGHVMNAVIGLAAEAGEVLDIHKKMWFHEPKDYSFFLHKIKHELGDVCFYLPKVMELHGLTLEECIAANREKLESRHPELGKVEERFPEGYIK